VGAISGVFKAFQPVEVFLPSPSDVHTDHRAVFDAAAACTKWFRYPSVKRVLAYETPSETDFGLATGLGFRPNVFVDIAPYIEGKSKAMETYASEIAAFPFPRSHEALRSLAKVRGAASGYLAAEAIELLRERS
jgi:LmbE family N-acetylglucosaminyl deacetylase